MTEWHHASVYDINDHYSQIEQRRTGANQNAKTQLEKETMSEGGREKNEQFDEENKTDLLRS